MKKVNSFVVFLYFSPIILSLYIIFSTGKLLGDFRSENYNMSVSEPFIILFAYAVPLLVIYIMLKLVNKIDVINYEKYNFENVMFCVFIFVGIVTLACGANKIGQEAIPGIAGLFVKLASKFSPLAMLALLSFSRINLKKFLVCVSIVVFYGYRQQSLQGYLIATIALTIYILANYKINNTLYLFLFLTPVVLLGPIIDFLTFIYSLRNEGRGVAFNINEITPLLVGRVSSVSSYLYITSHEFISNRVSDYFSFGVFLERLTGLHLIDSVSPSEVFNVGVIGPNADYSIFMGLPGFLSFLTANNALVATINIVFLLFVLSVIYYLIPVVNKSYRITAFFIVIYMTLLSSDVWELSILFQSVINWRIIALMSRRKC